MEIEIWSDEFGVIWELVELSFGEDSEFLIRERNTLDALDGDGCRRSLGEQPAEHVVLVGGDACLGCGALEEIG